MHNKCTKLLFFLPLPLAISQLGLYNILASIAIKGGGVQENKNLNDLSNVFNALFDFLKTILSTFGSHKPFLVNTNVFQIARIPLHS